MEESANWLGISREALIDGIIERQKVSREQASQSAEDILNLDASLREPFRSYWTTGKLAELAPIEGYTLQDLVAGRKRSPEPAFPG